LNRERKSFITKLVEVERGRVENRREEKGKARGRRRTREFNNPKV
jgi:hypothetical protein